MPHNVACPSALIGASNFFELAVAAAVPVMLTVLWLVLRSRARYERRA